MKERPIIFSGPMVRAILEGRKTVTRRVMKPKHAPFIDNLLNKFLGGEWGNRPLPFRAGDRLWVKEAWRVRGGEEYEYQQHSGSVVYKDDADLAPPDYGISERWKHSIRMPRWASRITLEVTGVRVERLQDITEEDAIAEGVDAVSMEAVPRQATMSRRADFKQLWDSINAGRGFGWDVNPWVWVIEFKSVKK